jgi:transposase-like protein
MISDACLGLIESISEFYPDAKWQRCIVHFYRNVFSVVPRGKIKHVAMTLKAIHASEDRPAAGEKAEAVIKKLEAQKLRQAVKKVKDSIDETLTYYDFPDAHL